MRLPIAAREEAQRTRPLCVGDAVLQPCDSHESMSCIPGRRAAVLPFTHLHANPELALPAPRTHAKELG